MAMGACPGQIPMPCVPPALMVTATMVRACRYTSMQSNFSHVMNCKLASPLTYYLGSDDQISSWEIKV